MAADRDSFRVLFLGTSIAVGNGGIASANRNALRALNSGLGSERPLEVDCILYNDSSAVFSRKYLQFPERVRFHACGSNRLKFLWRTLVACLLRKPDLILVDHVYLSSVPYLLRSLFSIPYIVCCHGRELEFELSHLRRKALMSAAERFTNSEYTAELVARKFPGLSTQVCLLGIDELALPPVAKTDLLTILPDSSRRARKISRQMILFVGRLDSAERYKGTEELIRALPFVLARVPKAQLVIVGEGADADRLREVAHHCKVESAVLFTGFCASEHLSGLYRQCRLFAMPSRGEGFGIVYAEAMRFGKPCVASTADAAREVVSDGETGVLIDPDDIKTLADTLCKLLTHPTLSHRLGREGKKRYDRLFQYSKFAERFQEALRPFLPTPSVNAMGHSTSFRSARRSVRLTGSKR